MAHAETLQPGKKYEGKVTIEVPSAQLSFELPAGWSGILPPGTDWFHIGKDNVEGRVFLYAEQTSKEAIRGVMSSQFPVADAVMLSPKTPIAEEGDAMVADYDATDGMNQYQAHARVVSGQGGMSVAVVAVAPAASLEQYKALAKTIQKSLKFGVKAKATAKGSTGSGEWAQKLANKRVVKYHNASGYSEKTQYLMCGDGTFYSSFGATSVSQNGDGVSRSKNAGRWSVQGNILTLQYSDGTSATVTLEERNGQWFVDGVRWLREDYFCQ